MERPRLLDSLDGLSTRILINESKMEERVGMGWDGKVEGRNGVWVRMVVMRVMEDELGGKEDGMMNGRVCGMEW